MRGVPQSQQTLDIIEYRKRHPCVSGNSIAEKFGVSRQWVNFVLKRADEKTTTATYGYLAVCPQCGGRRARNTAMCSSCFHKEHWIPIACAYCGKIKEVHKSRVLTNVARGQKHWFCNRNHQMMYFWHGSLIEVPTVEVLSNKLNENTL